MIRVWEANEAPITATAGGREKGPSCPVVCASCKRRPASKPVDTMNDSQGSLERNIAAFNADAAALGGYAYTAIDRWSARHATRRQTEKLVQILTQNFSPNVEVDDIGCGDGTFTLEIAERFQPAAICGIDPAADAIAVARSRIPRHLRGSVSFEVGDIYNLQAVARAGAIAVVRGVLHHLDRPRAAIAELARHFSFVIALEPNGYNPAMKIIERASKYHREHDEKSYWPPTLNRWFREEGFVPASQEFFCLVPYFASFEI